MYFSPSLSPVNPTSLSPSLTPTLSTLSLRFFSFSASLLLSLSPSICFGLKPFYRNIVPLSPFSSLLPPRSSPHSSQDLHITSPSYYTALRTTKKKNRNGGRALKRGRHNSFPPLPSSIPRKTRSTSPRPPPTPPRGRGSRGSVKRPS